MDEDDQNTVNEAASKPSQERKNVKKKMTTQDLMPNEISKKQAGAKLFAFSLCFFFFLTKKC